MRALRAHAKAWLAAIGLSLSLAHAATPPNTSITNTATASFTVSGVPIAVSGAATVVTTTGAPATIQLLSYASGMQGLPAGFASSQNVPPTQCQRAGSGMSLLPAPVVPGTGSLSSPGTYLLSPTSVYATGDALFVQVTDYDANVNAGVQDTLTVTVQTSGGDSEVLQLTETGPSTGVFVGYLQTTPAAPQSGNCVLSTGINQTITATYTGSGGRAAVSASALVDPMGLIFDSSSGAPVSGATITVLNAATGQPAAVLGEDGVSTYPSSMVSGSTVRDSGGTTYTFEPGYYRFPRLAPGTYRFVVQPPPGYRFPSKALDSVLQALPGLQFRATKGDRGEPFTLVPGPAVQIDVPVDPGPIGELNIVKTAGKNAAAIGESVPYQLAITNRDAYDVPGVVVADHLPPGFRYRKGSARLNDAPMPDPQVGPDGRSLLFSLGVLGASASVNVRYVAAVSAGAVPGQAENTAQATGRVVSNIAKAYVTVTEDLNRSHAIVAGRVTLAPSCEADANSLQPLRGVRVMLQDGTFVLTDAEGNWHADNLRPGTHVVQLDTTTLPAGMELKNCQSNSRTAGRDFSQFINVQGGTLWRADFRLVAVPSCLRERLSRDGGRLELALSAPVANEAASATILLPEGVTAVPGSLRIDGQDAPGAEARENYVIFRLPAQHRGWRHVLSFATAAPLTGDVKASVRVQPVGTSDSTLEPVVLHASHPQAEACAPMPLGALAKQGAGGTVSDRGAQGGDAPTESLIEQLPYDDKWLAAATPGNEWLHPKVGFTPALPVVKAAVKHAKGSEVELKVNGAPVDPLRYDGQVLNPTGEWALSTWRAIDLREGPNTLSVRIRDAAGKVLLEEQRVIFYSSAPSRVEYVPQRSQLVADGRTPPVLAVRMLDQNGQPVRRGMSGEFQVNAPYLSKQQADAIQRDPLAGTLGGRPKFTIGEDGIALIPLQPTTQSGEVVLRFDFGQGPQEVRAWLSADLREWVLVGFAEGTLAHKQLSGNMEALQDSAASEQLLDRNRIAFYAKGQVKGEYLLTVAYDSAKDTAAASKTLGQAIDPNQYYTLYADATQAQFDAASASKLYLKIEKKQFYALFGDFNTGLTVTELGRYSRTLNGVKTEYKGERASVNAFAARTSQSFVRDELQGDGTSGLYHLRGRNILVGSDKVRIEVRDRFQPDRVLSVRSMAPYLDYQIDDVQGTLYFREPVASRDADFNPQIIVAEYEVDGGREGTTYGGRAAVKPTPGSEVGVTHIHEGIEGREATLTAADATVKLGQSNVLKAEVATSHRNTDVGPESGRAYLVEAKHEDGNSTARAYASQEQPGFGLGQQAAAAAGQRKVGADAKLKLSETTEVQGTASRQEDLLQGGRRELAEGRVQWAGKDGLTLNGGARAVSETDSSGVENSARQVIAGASYEMLDRRLVLRAASEIDVHGPGTVAYPDRVTVGADYRLGSATTLFVQHEIARGELLHADTTRAGVRSPLWSGAEAQLSAGNQNALDGGRLYAGMGLVQHVKLGEHWSANAGVDRVHTLHSTENPLGPAQPLPSGTTPTSTAGLLTSDYTAVTGSLNYRADAWSGNGAAEWRGSQADTKVNLQLGLQRRLEAGRVAAIGLLVNRVRGTEDTRKITGRASYASRPNDSEWMWLHRVDYVEESNANLGARLFTRKLIASANANWEGRHSQVALQYGVKYVREMLGDADYSGFTGLIGLEARQDLGEHWDVGLHAGMLETFATRTRSYQLGLSVGYRLATNTWVSLGYNLIGLSDADFPGAQYRRKGVYVNMRMKFDQDTFGLNEQTEQAPAQAPHKP